MKTQNHRRDGQIAKETISLFLLGFFTLIFLCMAEGCTHAKPVDDSGGKIIFVTGKAQIVSFDSDMRYAVLRTTKGTRTAWWDSNTQVLRGSQLQANWQGKPGDNLEITGFMANGEVFLRKVMLK